MEYVRGNECLGFGRERKKCVPTPAVLVAQAAEFSTATIATGTERKPGES